MPVPSSTSTQEAYPEFMADVTKAYLSKKLQKTPVATDSIAYRTSQRLDLHQLSDRGEIKMKDDLTASLVKAVPESEANTRTRLVGAMCARESIEMLLGPRSLNVLAILGDTKLRVTTLFALLETGKLREAWSEDVLLPIAVEILNRTVLSVPSLPADASAQSLASVSAVPAKRPRKIQNSAENSLPRSSARVRSKTLKRKRSPPKEHRGRKGSKENNPGVIVLQDAETPPSASTVPEQKTAKTSQRNAVHNNNGGSSGPNPSASSVAQKVTDSSGTRRSTTTTRVSRANNPSLPDPILQSRPDDLADECTIGGTAVTERVARRHKSKIFTTLTITIETEIATPTLARIPPSLVQPRPRKFRIDSGAGSQDIAEFVKLVSDDHGDLVHAVRRGQLRHVIN